jgi:hypothetical protein
MRDYTCGDRTDAAVFIRKNCQSQALAGFSGQKWLEMSAGACFRGAWPAFANDN